MASCQWRCGSVAAASQRCDTPFDVHPPGHKESKAKAKNLRPLSKNMSFIIFLGCFTVFSSFAVKLILGHQFREIIWATSKLLIRPMIMAPAVPQTLSFNSDPAVAKKFFIARLRNFFVLNYGAQVAGQPLPWTVLPFKQLPCPPPPCGQPWSLCRLLIATPVYLARELTPQVAISHTKRSRQSGARAPLPFGKRLPIANCPRTKALHGSRLPLIWFFESALYVELLWN